ncbi:hypothetical protein HOY80DRAFT_1132878 [Tuber brumale]|nr:hypothetical protein HOY80DRAFT_1132878 [Tuber brumale]
MSGPDQERSGQECGDISPPSNPSPMAHLSTPVTREIFVAPGSANLPGSQRADMPQVSQEPTIRTSPPVALAVNDTNIGSDGVSEIRPPLVAGSANPHNAAGIHTAVSYRTRHDRSNERTGTEELYDLLARYMELCEDTGEEEREENDFHRTLTKCYRNLERRYARAVESAPEKEAPRQHEGQPNVLGEKLNPQVRDGKQNGKQ